MLRSNKPPRFNLPLILFAGLIMSTATALAQTGRPEEAVSLYAQGKYREALPLFLAETKANPKRSPAFLHAANCYFKLGNLGYAKQTYRYIMDNFPGTNNAKLAAEFMQKIDPASVNGSQTTSTGSSSKASAATGTASRQTSLDDLIKVTRPQADHPPVSVNVEHSIRKAANSLPESVKELFRRNGITICLTTTLIDKEPSLKNRQGRGYDGYTFRACPGMFNGHEVIICERTIDETDDSLKESISLPYIVNTFYHECGHAVDYYKGDISASEEFKHAYLLDSAHIDPETKADLAYFLQKSAAGQEECCGELIGILLGKQDRKTDKMRESFPLTIGLLKKKLSDN